jgi:hypothetical protein
MSSVTRFLRQRETGQTLLKYTAGDQLFVMIPGSGNYVGNYPNSPFGQFPGYVVQQTNVNSLTNAVYRDMGKTIYCSVGTTSAAPTSAARPGYFREVQILVPSLVANPLSVTNFGVGGSGALTVWGTGLPGTLPAGGNAGDAGYATFYIPIVVGGVVASNDTGTALVVSDAGLRIGEQL